MDVERWRAETPGCATRAHLNNAGAALMPAPVVQAMRDHLDRETDLGGYEAADAAAAEIKASYTAIGDLVGVPAHRVAVVTSATHAFAQALASVDFIEGDVLLTSTDDYISNQLMYLSLARRRGVRVVRVADLPEGGVDPDAVRDAIRAHRPRLAAFTWIPTNGGLIQPVEAIGAACREAEVPFLLDACQAVGQLPVEFERLGCDYLATTARKFLRGPRGIGFLAVSDRVLARGDHPLLVDMRGATWTAADAFELVDDARRFEQWEVPYALLLGMGAAARYASEVGVVWTAERAHALGAEVRLRLAAIPGVRSLDHGARLSAIATFAVAERTGRELVLALRARGINTSAQSRGDAVIDLDRKQASSLLRVSPHYYNTAHELEQLDLALRELLA